MTQKINPSPISDARIVFSNKLLGLVRDLLDGQATLAGTHARLKMLTDLKPISGVPMAKFVDVPKSSPVMNALETKPRDVTRDGHEFIKAAKELLQEFDGLAKRIEELSKYHPTIVQRDYIVSYMQECIVDIKNQYNVIPADQISFELPQ